jgi:hypothetical protein
VRAAEQDIGIVPDAELLTFQDRLPLYALLFAERPIADVIAGRNRGEAEEAFEHGGRPPFHLLLLSSREG